MWYIIYIYIYIYIQYMENNDIFYIYFTYIWHIFYMYFTYIHQYSGRKLMIPGVIYSWVAKTFYLKHGPENSGFHCSGQRFWPIFITFISELNKPPISIRWILRCQCLSNGVIKQGGGAIIFTNRSTPLFSHSIWEALASQIHIM